MEIQADLFIGYLKKMNLNKTYGEVVIDFGNDGINMGVFYEKKLLVQTSIPKDLFVQYEALGKLNIKNLSKFVDKLKKHTKENSDARISIKKSEFHIHIEDTKNGIKFKERFAETIESVTLPEIGIDWTKEFSTTLESSELKKFLEISSVYKKPDLLVEVGDNKLKLKIYHDETDESTIKTISLGSTLGAKITKKSSVFDIDAINLIVDRLDNFTKSQVYIMNEGPIRIVEINSTNKIKDEYILAPMETPDSS